MFRQSQDGSILPCRYPSKGLSARDPRSLSLALNIAWRQQVRRWLRQIARAAYFQRRDLADRHLPYTLIFSRGDTWVLLLNRKFLKSFSPGELHWPVSDSP